MNPEDYHLEFYSNGNSMPVKAWLEELDKSDPIKHDALVYGLSQILARQGTNVCSTEFGKSLRRGLFEFRLRHTRDELQAKVQPHLGAQAGDGEAKIMLRVFFGVYGDKIVLLLGGYDKAVDPSAKRQNNEIAEARKRLKAHTARQRATDKQAAKATRSGGSSSEAGASADDRVPPGQSFLMWFRNRRRRNAPGVGRRRN